MCFGMQESRPSKVLRNELGIVASETSFDQLSTNEDDGAPSANTFTRSTLVMPIKFFFTEPIVFFTSLLAAIVYGVVYLFVSDTIPCMFSRHPILTHYTDGSLSSHLHRPLWTLSARFLTGIFRDWSRRLLHIPTKNLRYQALQQESSTKRCSRARRQAFWILRRSSSPRCRAMVVCADRPSVGGRHLSVAFNRLATLVRICSC